MKKLIYFLLPLLLACQKDDSFKPVEALVIPPTAKTYTVQQGNNACDGFNGRLAFRPYSLFVEPYFNESCKYIIAPEDQGDINKFYRIGFGDHRKNSVGFGWRWTPELNAWEMFVYMHKNWAIEAVYMTYVYEGEVPNMRMIFDYKNNRIGVDTYVMKGTTQMRSYHAIIPFNFPFITAGYYTAPVYFGGGADNGTGDTKAPHKITIPIVHN